MRRKRISKKIALLCIVMSLNSNFVFALDEKIYKDLEMFMQIYEVDDDSGALFEMVEDSKDYKVNAVSLSKNINDEELKKLALSYIGKGYKYGAAGPEEFDCSGLVLDYYKNLNKMIPRTSMSQSEFGIYVEKDDLQVGDIVFFDTRSSTNANDIKINVVDTVLLGEEASSPLKRKVTHNGIYIGDGKFVHASSGSIMRVVVEDLNSKYFSQRYLFARRYL